MNNIFTFDIEDEIEQVQSQQINQYQWQPKRDSETKQKTSNSKQFTFEDFQQEQAVEVNNKNNRKIPLSQLSQNIRVQQRQKEQKKKSVQLQKQHTNKNEVNQSCQFKKKQCNQIVPGLEVEDLGVKDMEYVHDKKALKVNDLRKFLYTPLGDYKVKAIIKKQEGNVFNLNVKFNVYIEQNNRYLFTISRQGISQYIFSLDKNHISEKKKSYIGKMIGNMVGTQFLLFDAGFSPNETRSLQCCRKQFASIKYSGSTGPRKFTTIISTNCQGFYALEPQQNILEQKWDKKQREYLSILYSKAPQLDPEDGNYKLDFKGIVKKASVKNFILGGVQWDDSLIFGKIDNNLFVMQIKQPLSVFQAAAISISSIHYKLSWR